MEYLPGRTLEDYEATFTESFPDMASVLWLDRPGVAEVLGQEAFAGNEFGSDESGRGDSFRRAHERSSVKSTGMSSLLELATGCSHIDRLPAGFRLLDVLGGSGTLVRVTRELPRWRTATDWILTGDLAPEMVEQALAYGLPAIRQPAQFLLCRDGSLDAVLVAYGAHHIPETERAGCYEEALRVLKPGGRLVVHDFETGTAMANWFEKVVHTWSATGHDYVHFTVTEFEKDLRATGFVGVDVTTMYDPITIWAATADEARDKMLTYVRNAYGLIPPDDVTASTDVSAWIEELVTSTIRYDTADFAALASVPDRVRANGTLTVYESPEGWTAELPRLSLVAIATKG